MKTSTSAKDSARLRNLRQSNNGQHAVTINKILAPIDFSAASEKALKYAERLAEEFHAELILLHVLEPPTSLAFEALPAASVVSQKEIATAEKSLRHLTDEAQAAGAPTARWTLSTGVATHEIVEAAKNLGLI